MLNTEPTQTAALRSMDRKIFTGLADLMFDLQASGFDDEFHNSMVLRELNNTATAMNANSLTVRTFYCFTAKAEPAVRIEIRNAIYEDGSTPSVVVLRAKTDNQLQVVH